MQWVKFRDSKAGIKLHLVLDSHEHLQYSNNAIISVTKEHDVACLNDLVVLSNTFINVFDRGYVDYKVFDQFADEGALFVTRLKANTEKWLLERYPVETSKKIRYDTWLKSEVV